MTISIKEAQAHLSDLLHRVAEGEEVSILSDEGMTFKLVHVVSTESDIATNPKSRTPGLGKGSVLYVSDDFDEDLSDSFWLGDG